MEETTVISPQLADVRRHLPPLRVVSKFIATGVLVAAVQLGLVTQVLLDVPIQLALGLTYIVVLTLHFTLNRQWVFTSDTGYAFHLSGQGARYLLVAVISYLGTALGIVVLPGLLGIPDLAAFFVATAMMACFSFIALRLWIFRAAPAGRDAAP